MLHELEVDVTRSKGGRSNMNYHHFHRVHVTDEAPRSAEGKAVDYFFSVNFDLGTACLTNQHALWVKNAGPLHCKYKVVHAYGQNAFSVLSNVMQELEALVRYFSFEEVYRSAKDDNRTKALLHLLDDVANQQYRGYLSHTSEMMVLKK
ncbi:hypothetical protein SAMN05444128_3353 [Pontibacter indicus]|uniref:Uncharacterized protein n=2 Tax=Pontibacter indicus TaxID=1317125 RepID=A0A1R3XPV8_9BACT|nr:hypothetical protein SAMN05444128_3353 [Pontibacter indicus]